MSITIAGFSAIPAQRHEVTYACRLGRDTILCCGPLHESLNREHTITINNHPAQKPYLGTTLGNDQIILILRSENLGEDPRLSQVAIESPLSQTVWQHKDIRLLEDKSAEFPQFIETLSPPALKKTFFLFYNFFRTQPDAAKHPLFMALFHQLRQRLAEQETQKPEQIFWAAPDVLYWEMELPTTTETGQLLITTPQRAFMTNAEYMILDESPKNPGMSHISAIAHFPAESWQNLQKAKLTLYTQQQLFLPGTLPAPETSPGRLLNQLNGRDQLTRQRLREFLASRLLKWHHESKTPTADIPKLLRNLQLFVPVEHTSVHDANHPFGINIEHCFPLGTASFFCAGWLRDPLHLVESMTLHSDLGFSIPVTDVWKYFPKASVDELYQNGPYANQRGDWGITAQIPLPESMQKQLKDTAELHTIRFEITLQGGLHYSISPPPRLFNPFYAREQLLTNIAPYTKDYPEADACVRDVALQIQKLCAEKASIQYTYQFGTPIKKPATSIIIPLYRCMDFIKPQLAHFSSDKTLTESAEIIYVLDDPEQATAVRSLVENLSELYNLPLSLVVMAQNTGYASATNAGASLARGKYLLLMNSDILPIANNWLPHLTTILDKEPRVGAITPKLLYEDDSIQHAGIYFELGRKSNIYENAHYYKGYAANYPAAQKSRDVPAVTGACMLLRKKDFNAVGGYTADYLIGDFEDSDLCLKLRQKKLSSRYCAEISLYHLERQSITQHESHNDAAFRYNSWAHHQRWSETIRKIKTDGNC